jgi:hypothetical protein
VLFCSFAGYIKQGGKEATWELQIFCKAQILRGEETWYKQLEEINALRCLSVSIDYGVGYSLTPVTMQIHGVSWLLYLLLSLASHHDMIKMYCNLGSDCYCTSLP